MIDKFAADIGTGVIEVPLPPSVILAFGCRPGTVISLHIVDGQVRVLPDQDTIMIRPTMQTVTNIAEACRQWWKSQ